MRQGQYGCSRENPTPLSSLSLALSLLHTCSRSLFLCLPASLTLSRPREASITTLRRGGITKVPKRIRQHRRRTRRRTQPLSARELPPLQPPTAHAAGSRLQRVGRPGPADFARRVPPATAPVAGTISSRGCTRAREQGWCQCGKRSAIAHSREPSKGPTT